ncbi:MAG TPA: hypothetical protein VGD67_21770 [Pseudonocardiaceae bacterium]
MADNKQQPPKKPVGKKVHQTTEQHHPCNGTGCSGCNNTGRAPI